MIRKLKLELFREYINSNSVGGIVLISCVVISLFIANLPCGPAFDAFLGSTMGWKNSWVDLEFSILHWINDGLMTVFFLLVGLEIKRELIKGELSAPQKAALPVIAAFGGAILPAVIFYVLNRNEPTSVGWGIPMATDIAFALAALSVLGKRVPPSLKIFLAALAIVDDLIAIGVIALFYSSAIHWNYLLMAGGVLVVLFLFNRFNLKHIAFYIVPGLFVWYFIHHSGIHATIAGVLVAMLLPLGSGSKESPLERLEHILTKPVNFFIVPLFALANTNIRFEAAMVNGLVAPLGAGIILGLFAGKTLGIFLSTRLAVFLKVGKLPRNASWKHIIGLGMLAGIGFTMSIFISLLSFNDPIVIAEAKLAILIASVLATLAGCLFMRSLRQKAK